MKLILKIVPVIILMKELDFGIEILISVMVFCKEKYKYTLIYGISDKTLTVEKSFRIRNDKVMNL